MRFVHATCDPDGQSHLRASIEPGTPIVVADEPHDYPHTIAERGSARFNR